MAVTQGAGQLPVGRADRCPWKGGPLPMEGRTVAHGKADRCPWKGGPLPMGRRTVAHERADRCAWKGDRCAWKGGPLPMEGRTVAHGKADRCAWKGGPLRSEGRPLPKEGRPLPMEGRPLRNQGRPLPRGEAGPLLMCHGRAWPGHPRLAVLDPRVARTTPPQPGRRGKGRGMRNGLVSARQKARCDTDFHRLRAQITPMRPRRMKRPDSRRCGPVQAVQQFSVICALNP
jgi:nitrite reductase/ring-hydroxylating ferredoxin subunit